MPPLSWVPPVAACPRRCNATAAAAAATTPDGVKAKVPPRKQRTLDVLLGARKGGWVNRDLGYNTCVPLQCMESPLGWHTKSPGCRHLWKPQSCTA